MDITVTSSPKCDLVAVKGRIDSYTSPNFTDALKYVTDQNQFRIILDLGEVVSVNCRAEGLDRYPENMQKDA